MKLREFAARALLFFDTRSLLDFAECNYECAMHLLLATPPPFPSARLGVSFPLSHIRARELMFDIQFTRINSTIDCSIRRPEWGKGQRANDNVGVAYFNASRACKSEVREMAVGKYL